MSTPTNYDFNDKNFNSYKYVQYENQSLQNQIYSSLQQQIDININTHKHNSNQSDSSKPYQLSYSQKIDSLNYQSCLDNSSTQNIIFSIQAYTIIQEQEIGNLTQIRLKDYQQNFGKNFIQNKHKYKLSDDWNQNIIIKNGLSPQQKDQQLIQIINESQNNYKILSKLSCEGQYEIFHGYVITDEGNEKDCVFNIKQNNNNFNFGEKKIQNEQIQDYFSDIQQTDTIPIINQTGIRISKVCLCLIIIYGIASIVWDSIQQLQIEGIQKLKLENLIKNISGYKFQFQDQEYENKDFIQYHEAYEDQNQDEDQQDQDENIFLLINNAINLLQKRISQIKKQSQLVDRNQNVMQMFLKEMHDQINKINSSIEQIQQQHSKEIEQIQNQMESKFKEFNIKIEDLNKIIIQIQQYQNGNKLD